MNHPPTYVRTFSLHKVKENCRFLDHPPTPMSLRNIKMAPNVDSKFALLNDKIISTAWLHYITKGRGIDFKPNFLSKSNYHVKMSPSMYPSTTSLWFHRGAVILCQKSRWVQAHMADVIFTFLICICWFEVTPRGRDVLNFMSKGL